MDHNALGTRGEDLAADHLARSGYAVLERNWRDRTCEIDIIARHGATIVFVEVKTRRSTRHGSPAQAVTARKLQHMRRGAVAWLACHRTACDGIRLDVISVLLPGRGPAVIEHITGVGQ